MRSRKDAHFILFSSVYINFFRFLYANLKLFPTDQNKILFLSRQFDNPSVDFRMLKAELEKQNQNLKIVMLTKRIEKTPREVFFKNTPEMFRQMYHLATSKVCIIDGYNIAVSALKHKPSLRVIQIWHSLGAIKKFGKASLRSESERNIAKSFRMHKGYDVIVCASEKSAKFFAEAFGYRKDVIEICGLPRIDYLLNPSGGGYNREKILRAYPELKNRKNILYAPTFRTGKCSQMRELLDAIDTEKYNLIVKLHPNIKLQCPKTKNIFECQDFTTLQLLSVADYVITDYSAVSLEAAILKIPLYFFAYDLEKYKKNPGLNIDLNEEFPGLVFDDARALVDCLSKEKYPKNLVRNYAKKYIKYNDTKNTERLANIVLRELAHA